MGYFVYSSIGWTKGTLDLDPGQPVFEEMQDPVKCGAYVRKMLRHTDFGELLNELEFFHAWRNKQVICYVERVQEGPSNYLAAALGTLNLTMQSVSSVSAKSNVGITCSGHQGNKANSRNYVRDLLCDPSVTDHEADAFLNILLGAFPRNLQQRRSFLTPRSRKLSWIPETVEDYTDRIRTELFTQDGPQVSPPPSLLGSVHSGPVQRGDGL